MSDIRLVLSDVDGTLVTNDKRLTDRAVAAVGALRDAGIRFAITSGRPPRGMSMLLEPLALTTPVAAFNGGLMMHPDMTVIEQKTIPEPVVQPMLALLRERGLYTWLYCGPNWYVVDPHTPHIEREASTVQFQPTLLESFDHLTEPVVKIVGISDDHDAVESAAEAARDAHGHQVSAARSEPYYVDVTNPDANKGAVVQYLSKALDIPLSQIATLGDMPNDVLMFAHSGMSIAMGNADRQVQRAARHVTASNEDDGFAKAVERYVLDG